MGSQMLMLVLQTELYYGSVICLILALDCWLNSTVQLSSPSDKLASFRCVCVQGEREQAVVS